MSAFADILESPAVRSGSARLQVEKVAGLSAMTANVSSSPLKLLVPQPRGTSVWAYASSFGGGLVAGDQTRLDIRVAAGARCFFGTQAAGKIYRNPARLPCSHTTRAELAGDSLLVFAPDPVQLFAESSYSQRQEFFLANTTAALVLADGFTSGRAARGERWAFNRLQTRNDLFVAGERVLVDSLLLAGSESSLLSLHRTGRFNCVAMLLLFGEALKQIAAALLADLAARPVERRAPLICSASPIRGGAILRVAGESVEAVSRELRRHLKPAAGLLGGDPWERKW